MYNSMSFCCIDLFGKVLVLTVFIHESFIRKY